MCRVHLLSHNVGVVKPFKTVAVIKGYADKLDSWGVDAPCVSIFHCISFYLCKTSQYVSESCRKSIFI